MDLKLESRDGFLLAIIAGRVSLNKAIESFRRVFDRAADLGFDKILVDFSEAKGKLSDMERYEFGRAMAEYSQSRSKNPRIAMVGKPPTITQFTGLVASNRGANVKTFTEPQAGIDWLNEVGFPGRRRTR